LPLGDTDLRRYDGFLFGFLDSFFNQKRSLMTAKRQTIFLIIISSIFLLILGLSTNFKFDNIGFFDFSYPNEKGANYYNIDLKFIWLGYLIFAVIWIVFIIRQYKREDNES
jgi:hypothetical protein